jgi:hypothetical protein
VPEIRQDVDDGDLLHEHVRTGAGFTLGTTPVDRQAASGCGNAEW